MKRRRRGEVSGRIWGLRLGLLVLIVAVWFYLADVRGISSLILPTMRSVGSAFIDVVVDGATWPNVGVTVLEIAAALVIAIGVGLAVGFWSSRTRLRARTIEPFVVWIYLAPLTLFYPLFVVWFGIGIWSKILYAGLSGVAPVALNALRGFVSVDRQLIRMGSAYGASDWQIDRIIKVGAARPMVLSGVRLGAAFVLIGVLLAEMLGSEHGLGYLITFASQSLLTAQTFALIGLAMLVVGGFQILIRRLVNVGNGRDS